MPSRTVLVIYEDTAFNNEMLQTTAASLQRYDSDVSESIISDHQG
jgi:hypothetical protein